MTKISVSKILTTKRKNSARTVKMDAIKMTRRGEVVNQNDNDTRNGINVEGDGSGDK